MFRSVFIKLLSREIITDSYSVENEVFIISEDADFTLNSDMVIQIMANKLQTLTIQGTVTTIPDFPGFKLVKNINILATSVTSIPKLGFYQNTNIENVNIHEGLEEIGSLAFAGSLIKTINLNNVKRINNYASQKCPNLQSIETTLLASLGIAPFYGSGIESLTLGGSFTKLPRSMCQNCYKLKTSKIIASTITIPQECFENCYLLENFIFEGTSFAIGNLAFAYSGLKSFDFSKVTTVSDYAFQNSLLETVEVTEINGLTFNNNVFIYCNKLTSVSLDVSGINYDNSDGLFSFCASLVTATLHSSVTSLPKGIFKCCSVLKTINAPGITILLDRALENCPVLDTLSFSGNVISKIGYLACYNSPFINLKTSGTQIFERSLAGNKVIEWLSLKNAHYYGCANMTALTTVVLTSGSNIAEGCFCHCTSLQSVTLPSSYTILKKFSFAYTALSNGFDLGQVTRIENYCFYGSGITSLIIRKNLVLSDPVGQFQNCKSLTRISLMAGSNMFSAALILGNKQPIEFDTTGNTVFSFANKILKGNNKIYYVSPLVTGSFTDASFTFNTIEDNAFSFNKEVSDVTFSRFYDTCSFYNSGIRYFTYSTSVTAKSLPNNMFYNCTQLEQVVLPDGLTTIKYSCFENCIKLAEINIPSSCNQLGKACFKNCQSLTAIDISMVTLLWAEVFYGCTKLTTIIYPTNQITRGNGNFTFANMGITELDFDLKIADWSVFTSMFYGCQNLKKCHYLPTSNS